jgi:hypothetical protein
VLADLGRLGGRTRRSAPDVAMHGAP